MSDTSTYLGNALLNWIQNSGTTLATKPTSVFASLWNGDPDSGGSEVTQTISLTRQAITWSAVSARAMNNSADLTFGTASSSGTVTFVAIFDSATVGNQICKKAITSTAIANGNVVKILATNLVLSY
jgi:hypothetical protein